MRAAEGHDVPGLARVPVIRAPDKWLWEAFCQLSEKRWRTGETPQPIPVSEILAYALFHKIEEEQYRDYLFYVISALDSMYMKHHWDLVMEAEKRRARQHK